MSLRDSVRIPRANRDLTEIDEWPWIILAADDDNTKQRLHLDNHIVWHYYNVAWFKCKARARRS
jgi:hypothetical protein